MTEPRFKNDPLTSRQIATVLHALRVLQETRDVYRDPQGYGGDAVGKCGCCHEEYKRGVAARLKPGQAAQVKFAENACDHFEDENPLTSDEIDVLAELFNFAPALPETL